MPPEGPRKAHPFAAIEAALAAGRTFEAVDLARTALATEPPPSASRRRTLDWLLALALLRSGALAAAESLIERLETTPPRPVKGEGGARRASTLEELWRASGRPAARDQALKIRLARAKSGGFAEAASASLLAKAKGEAALAGRLAARALAATDAADPAHRLERVRLALVQGTEGEASRLMAELAPSLADRPLERAEARRRLEALEAFGVTVPMPLLDAVPAPRLVIYCGVADPKLAGHPAVAEAVAEALAAVEAEIAYGSATAGTDLLFAEAALKRGAELNLVLPCATAAFPGLLVDPASGEWRARYDRVLAAAASVTSVAEDRQTVDGLVLAFGNRVIDGTARLRAASLGTRPYLIAALELMADSGPGGAGDFIDHWGDPSRLRLIDLDELGTAQPAPPRLTAELPAAAGAQRIAGLLFADVVGFTRLDDALLPQFWRFMAAVAAHMAETAGRPRMLRSWGDALFVMADTALATADYAIALQAAVAAVDARAFGLPSAMEMRIAAHAGPVHEGRHPLTGEAMVFGGNVNRAARIEPITVPGRVYASAAFVAWLTSEESAAEAEARLEGLIYRPRYRCTYRGIVELAKRYGPQAVYEVDPWRPTAASPEARIDGRRMTMTLANEAAEHARLAAEIARFVAPFGIQPDQLAPFEIAFDEVMTNICRYAWADAGQHAVLVEAELARDRLTVTFADDGRAFDPLTTTAPTLDHDVEERAMGGLGIHLVRELMDEVRYARDEPFNRLTLAKRLAMLTQEKASATAIASSLGDEP